MNFIPYASSSHGNFYQVAGESSRLLIECGIPIREIKRYLGFDLSRIDGCLLTHAHGDHAKSAREIMYHGIDLYCSYGTAEALDLSGYRLHIIKAMQQFKIGPWVIMPFDVQHDVKEPLGFLVANGKNKLLFATDTYFIKYNFNGLTHIAVECNWSKESLSPDIEFYKKKRLMESHMGLHTLCDFLQANDLSTVKEIHLLHLSDDNSLADEFERHVQCLTGKPVFVAPRRQP